MTNFGTRCLCIVALATGCFNPNDGGGGADEGSTSTTASSSDPTSATTPTATTASTGSTVTMSGPTSGDPTSATMSSSGTATTDSTSTTDPDTSTSGPSDSGESSTGVGLVCEGRQIDCGGVCIDPLTDVTHCGACDHDCLGGMCDTGVCQADELANGKGRLFMVQLISDRIYYGGDGVNVGRIDTDGNNDTIISAAGVAIEDRQWCYDSTATASEVLWGNDWVSAHWSVRGCAAPSCAAGPTQYISQASNVQALLYIPENNRLYWDQDSAIQTRVWPAGATSSIVTGATQVIALANDDSHLYWIDRQTSTNYDLRRVSIAGGTPENIASNRPTISFNMAISGSRLFWGEANDIVFAPLPAGIGTGAPTVLESAPGNVRELIADDDHVYWTASSPGSVQRCPVDDCSDGPESLATGLDRPWGINHDDEAVYFVTEGGEIYKAAK